MCDIASTYQVAGMTCGSCATKVKTAVESIPDVTGATVDIANATVTVHGHVTDEAVNAAIAQAGFAASHA